MPLITAEHQKQFQTILRKVQDAYNDSKKTGLTVYEIPFDWNVESPPFNEAREKLKNKGFLLERHKNPRRLIISW